MNDSYSIKDIIELLLGKLWLLILLTIVGGAGAFCYAHFLMPTMYESYTSMYVRNSSNVLGSFDIDIGELNASRSLLNTYVVVLKSNYVMEEVANQLELEYSLDELSEVFAIKDKRISISSLRSKVTMSSVEGTEVLKITATTTNPEISSAICNSIADSAEECLIRVVGAGSVEIIDVATPIYVPVSPNKPKTTMIGALAGLILAAGIILLIDFFDNTIRSSETLTEKYQKAVFGEIVSFGSGGSKKGEVSRSTKTILDPQTDFNVIENYKSIRSNIIFAFSTMGRKILTISSASPCEGKSVSASNIAIAFAQTESKILLIDADMRKPVQHKTFNLGNKKGLSTAIGHMNPVEESIHKQVYKQLDVMTAGPIPPNPSEMLASQQFSDLLDELEPQYDYIIIDTPPINVVSDTMVMGKLISGLLLVVKYASTTYEELQDAVKHAELSDINLIGFVLNNISRKGSGHYYSYKYKYKYKYKNYDYQYTNGSENTLDTVSTITMKKDAPLGTPAQQAETIVTEEPALEVSAEQAETVVTEEPALEVSAEQAETAATEEPAPEVPAEQAETAATEEPAPEVSAEQTETIVTEEPAPEVPAEQAETIVTEEPAPEVSAEQAETAATEEPAPEVPAEQAETAATEEPAPEVPAEQAETAATEEPAPEVPAEQAETAATEEPAPEESAEPEEKKVSLEKNTDMTSTEENDSKEGE